MLYRTRSWRGSDVGNIVGFADRYAPVATFEITTANYFPLKKWSLGTP